MTSTSPPREKTVGQSARPSRLPLLLLGLLSIVTFVGPFAIYLVLKGGRSELWPPDRAVEWWTFGGVTATAAILTVACVSSGLWAGRKCHGTSGSPVIE